MLREKEQWSSAWCTCDNIGLRNNLKVCISLYSALLHRWVECYYTYHDKTAFTAGFWPLCSNINTLYSNTSLSLTFWYKHTERLGVWFSFIISEWMCHWYLFWQVSIGQRDHHPDYVEVGEGSAGGKGAGQDGRLAPSHLDAALGHSHFQGPDTHCRNK